MKVKFCYLTNTANFIDGSIFSSSNGEIKVSASATIYNLPNGCHSSEEAIIYYYEQYGEKCVNHLRGAFAFCLYDSGKDLLLAARDRIGERRLYYSQTTDGVVISNSLRKILRDEIAQPQINVQHLLEPLRFTGPIDLQNTWIEQIKRVLPGQIITVTPKGIHSSRYWKLTHSDSFSGTRIDAMSRILDLMKESVDTCMKDSKAIAVTLSGGVDSSCVAALAQMTGHEVYSITTGYKGNPSCDERDVARRFAKEKGFKHIEYEFCEQDYIEAFEEMTKVIDEPITDSTAIAQWAMFKRAKKEGFDILLGGMGGDELFFGYPAWNNLSESLYKRRFLESLFPWNSFDKKKEYVNFVLHNLKHILFAGYPSKIEDRSFGWWIRDDYYRFVENATLDIDGDTYPLKDYPVYKDYAPCPLGKEAYLIYDDCFKKIMTGAYLFIDDCLGEAIEIENRNPLLDYKLVEFIMGIPLNMKYIPGKPKQFMKDILAGIVPDYILYANKRGFTSPATYIKAVSDNHIYSIIHTDAGFYNSALCDKMLTNLLW